MAISFTNTLFNKGPAGPAPETLAKRKASLIVAKANADSELGFATNEAKVLSLKQANQALAPYSDDLTVLKQITDNEAKIKKIEAGRNDQELTANNMESKITEGIFQTGKINFDSPERIVANAAGLYEAYSNDLKTEIDTRYRNDQPYDKLTTQLEGVEKQAQSFARLQNEFVLKQSREDDLTKGTAKTDYGFFIKTDPRTGKIQEFSIKPVDTTTSPPKGFFRTDSMYGGVPVYANGTRDPASDNKIIARVGASTYVAESESTEVPDATTGTINRKVLRLQNPKKLDEKDPNFGVGDQILNVFRTGERQKKFDISKGLYDLNISQDDFASPNQIPDGAFIRDKDNNFYLLQDGKIYTQGTAEALAESVGRTPDEIKDNSYFATKTDLDKIVSTYKPDVLPDSTTPANKPTSYAPNTLGRSVAGGLFGSKVTDTLAQSNDDSTSNTQVAQSAGSNLVRQAPGVRPATGIAKQESQTEKISSSAASKIKNVGRGVYNFVKNIG